MPSPNEPSSAVRAEQPVVAAMYDRLDEFTSKAARDLNRAKRSPTAGTPAAQVEREAMIRVYTERVGALVSAERRLCFGRLDFSAGGTPVYIGRLSLADDAQNLLLTDWRAPAAEPFYRATTATPMGVARRRHILLDGRLVSGVEDDVLDLDAVGVDSAYEGNGALMAALAARRTGAWATSWPPSRPSRTGSPGALPGILVVEGGPGWQDRRRPAPRGVPALHAPRPDRAQRCPRRRTQPAVPALHQPGPARPRGVQRGAGHSGAAVPSVEADRSRTPSRSSRATCGWPRSSLSRSATANGSRTRPSPSPSREPGSP